MLFLRFCRQNWPWLAVLLLYPAVFALVLALYGLPISEVGYAGALCLCAGLILFLLRYLRFRRRHAQLRAALMAVTLSEGLLPAPDDPIEADYQALIHALLADRSVALTDLEQAQAQRETYYTLWTHQIKTPLAAMKLILQSSPEDETRRELLAQLFQTEQYVDMALTYLRLDGDQTDFVIAPHALGDVVRRAVRHYAPVFIRRHIRMELSTIETTVYTDAKWLTFAIEQLLSNAVKYTPEGGSVRIRWEAPDALVVADTGIGIAPEDLPRVCECGFTGQNGHAQRQSTGIGLYLVNRTLQRLGHGFSLSSVPGQGTEARITLSTEPLRAD